MEPRIRNRFSQPILAQAAACYGVPVDAVHQLESAESYIYTFEKDGQSFILRIGHSLRRTVQLIQGEVEWINYLAENGAAVSSAVLSQNQRLVELIDDGEGGYFLATAFVKAGGRPPADAEETTAFYERYGQAIGRMHRLTKDYTPSPGTWRPHWDDPIMQDAIDFLPPSEHLAQKKLEAQIELLQTLPRDVSCYGLVHQDAHRGNFFVDGRFQNGDGTLTFFDFDDCCYTWFVADLAIVLFYATVGRDDASSYAQAFLPDFLRGYQRENIFDPAWFAQIPHFLKLRELELYAVIHRSNDVNNLTHWWDIRYMAGRKERIDADKPFLDMEFAKLGWE